MIPKSERYQQLSNHVWAVLGPIVGIGILILPILIVAALWGLSMYLIWR